MIYKYLYIPNTSISTNITLPFLLAKRSDRSASDGSVASTAADGNESNMREALKFGFDQKIVFDQGDTLTHTENIPIIRNILKLVGGI